MYKMQAAIAVKRSTIYRVCNFSYIEMHKRPFSAHHTCVALHPINGLYTKYIISYFNYVITPRLTGKRITMQIQYLLHELSYQAVQSNIINIIRWSIKVNNWSRNEKQTQF